MTCTNKQYSIIQLRRGSSAEFTSSNPILASGEPAFAVDTNTLKVGDGITDWMNLNAVGGGAVITNYGDNRLLTSDGSAGGINGESNLTFNGSTLLVSGTSVSLSGHAHVSSDITNFATSVSGLLPVKNIIAGTGINVSSTTGVYTISSTGSGIYADQAASILTTVFNKTGNPIPKMSAVYINGGQGDQPTIQLAIATGDATSAGTYGITYEAISNMSTGKVVVLGALTGVNTDPAHGGIAGATEGSVLYLSPTTSGALTTTKPSAPNHIVTMGNVIRVHQNEGVIEVRIVNGFELEELHNVAISGVTNGQFLQYNSASGLWLSSSSGNFSTLLINGSGVPTLGYVDNLLAANDAMIFKGTLGSGGTITSLPSIYNIGWTYKVITAGTYAGNVCEIGDLIIAIVDRPSGGGSDSDWVVAQTNLSNAVTATASSSSYVAKFSSTNVVTTGIIYDNGTNVGIGTSSPGEKLTVDGSIKLGDTTGNRLQFFRGGGTAYDYSMAKEGNHLGISTANDGATFRYTQFGYHSGSTWTPKTVINNYNGSIGINTTSPTHTLHMVGSGYVNGYLDVDNLRLDGNTISSTNSNGNIVLAPSGTGDVQVDADTLRVGDSNAAATITSNGTGNLTISTNSGTNSGSIVINQGSNGNIAITPNGTGEVDLSKVDIDGGSIDGTAIGANSASTGKFTQLYPTVVSNGNVSGSVATDVSTGQIFDMTVTGSTTLSNPTNSIDGVTIRWRIRQDGTGGHSVALGSDFIIPTSASSPLPWSTTANAMDILAATYHAGRAKWDVVAFVPGY